MTATYAPRWRGCSPRAAASADLTDPMLEDAAACLREGDSPVLHSDGGGQYHAESWRRICEANGVTRSMSRPGHSADNARCEGFFGLIKNLHFHHRDWSGWTAEEFAAEVGRWMVNYNERRRKQSLGWMTPMEYRRAALAGAV